MNLTDKLAIVTGGASGIGRATVEAFAAAGAHVVLADIDSDNGEATAAAMRSRGHRVDFVRLDVTDRSSIDAF